MEIINKNDTQKLVEKLENKKSISVKYVYKIKFNLTSTIHKFKARLVVKGYAQ